MSRSESILDSYPTLFRQKNHELPGQHHHHHHQDTDDQQHKESGSNLFRSPIENLSDSGTIVKEDPLPVIDLQFIDSEKLSDACTDWGIFRLVNHGIPLTLLRKLNELAVDVFRLGFESKQALFSSIPSSTLSYFWGTPALTPAGVALHMAKVKADSSDSSPEDGGQRAVLDFNWVEGFNVQLSELSHLQFDQHPLLHSFRGLLDEYGKHQVRIVSSIFEAMARNLNLCSSPEERECFLSPSTGVLRVYRYPACIVKRQEVWGLDVHTDSSVITILNQDEVGGLQFLRDKENTWMDAEPIPNTLIVHLGDMMQAMSDDKYKSVKHRVKVHRQKERISIGYFVFPADDCVIQSSTYKPFTYPDFRAQVQRDIKTLGFKVGLSRFELDKAP